MANIESANFEDTKEKICEARYFLDGMEKNQGDLKPFRYSLSAFVSAFFSITSFLCKELSHHRGFKEWYDSDLRPWMESDGKMRLLYKSRKTTVHIHRIPTRKNATVHLPSIGSGNKVSAEHKWYFDLYEEIQGIPDIDNLIKIDVMTICRTCLTELEHRLSLFLTQGCSSQFVNSCKSAHLSEAVRVLLFLAAIRRRKMLENALDFCR